METLRTAAGVLAGLASAQAPAQPAHIFGVHDDGPTPTDWITRCPSGTAWITATEGLGANPGDTGGKAYGVPAGSKVIARLNYGYHPQGTIPLPAQYGNFAARVSNFVAASTGCDTWVIGNETNLAVEWPEDGAGTLVSISPADYANCFRQCYAAIKAVKPSDKVVVQAIAPWGGPYGAGTIGSNSHGAQGDNWCDYFYKVLTEITTGPGAVMPDGIATHINTRGWNPSTIDPGPLIDAGSLTLDFGWGVHRDWIQFGIPRNLWNLPLYGTESNGLYYWQGGGPEGPGDPAYASGWLQAVYADIHAWNQNAALHGMPIYRCVNMYRWANADGWTIDAAPNRVTILADLTAAASAGPYNAPAFGGNALNPGTPSGVKITGIIGTADSDASQDPAPTTGFEPDKAFDGNATTKWSSAHSSATVDAHWIVADLGTPRSITGYIVRHASSTGLDNVNRNTIGFRIEVSNTSNTGPWTLHTMVRNNTPGGSGAAVTELVYTTPVTARYVRLYLNDTSVLTGTNDRGRIAEFEIYEPAGASVKEWAAMK